MFSQPKPMASLSSGLLARKGHARPAMRPQGFNGFGPLSGASHDDLGWNDMGAAEEAPAPPPSSAPLPPVLVERQALVEEVESVPVASEPVAATAPVETLPVSLAHAERIGRESARSGKAAFTLRLDAERHLRLRLASAVRNRSAQQLVTAALDAFLTTVPEAEALAGELAKSNR